MSKRTGTYVQDVVAAILLAKAIDGEIGCYEGCGDKTVLNCVPNEDVQECLCASEGGVLSYPVELRVRNDKGKA